MQFLTAPQVPGLDEAGHVEIAVGDAFEAVGPLLDKGLAPAMIGVPREDGEEVRLGNVAHGEAVSRPTESARGQKQAQPTAKPARAQKQS
jgi:hypothetical protein